MDSDQFNHDDGTETPDSNAIGTADRNEAQSHGSAATPVMLGKGLDVGTANFLAAVRDDDGSITVRRERNAFLDIDGDVHSRSMLTRLDVPYVVRDDRFLVIGAAAFDLANVFSRSTRRPRRC